MKNRFTCALVAILVLTGIVPDDAQAEDPKPYVLIVMDTSGSTEWTPDGDEEYPYRDNATQPDEWVPGTPMQIDPADPASGPSQFGPCFVWEPKDCQKYARPPFTYRYNDDHWQDLFVPSQPVLLARKDAMLGSYTGVAEPGNFGANHTGVRLRDDSQPRHVIIKEVLTGDMLLRAKDDPRDYENLSTVDDGPGCWFVPRQRGSTIQPLEDRTYCDAEPGFEDLPDHDEPRPHFQEVFDAQVKNGVLDKLANQAIFGVAMLDGYKDDVGSWEFKLNDAVDNSANIPGSNLSTAAGNGAGEEDSANYNLGVFRITGPKKLDIPPQFLEQLSNHVQATITDGGFLRDGSAGTIDVKKGEPELGLAYDKKANKYISDGYALAKQPIGKATPLAAAMMDVHQFLLNDERFESGDSGNRDPYGECRPKQIVLISDGYPEPEIHGGLGGDVGTESLTPAFGYDETKYPYEPTENEISKLVEDPAFNSGTPEEIQKFAPRVHVVALSVDDTDPAKKAAVLKKLARMARDGKTCASYFLPTHIPTTPGGTDCVAQATVPGSCFAGPQDSYPDYRPPNGSGTETCEYPALVLQTNDRDVIEQALFEVMSGIVGSQGTISRTRAAVSNFLDDDSFTAGGQYRVYSGVNTVGSYWRGILSREILPCSITGTSTFDASDSTATAGIDSTNLEAKELHVDVGYQVQCGTGTDGQCAVSTPTDNRRMFTTIPHENIYKWGDTNLPDVAPAVGRLFFTWEPALIAEGEEEFRQTTVPGVPAGNNLVGSRIPFRADQLHDVIQAQALLTISTWDTNDTAAVLNAPDFSSLESEVNVYRGRIPAKASGDPETMRVFSGILNSDPVVVPPPILDLPIESYRAFRAHYGDRPTMLYSATVDGTLHALHVGELNGRIQVRSQTSDNSWTESVDPAAGASVSNVGKGQREAWAYMPFTLLRDYADNVVSQGYLLDGSTVVRDVRLCQPTGADNQSTTACKFIEDTDAIPPQFQWRTVLVQALGLAGSGYFAMDVTRTGGLAPGAPTRTVEAPDPALLWEFDRDWERAQVKAMESSFRSLVEPEGALRSNYEDGACPNEDEFWRQPAMGLSISAPEIATLAIDVGHGIIQQRPVAVFAAGAVDENLTGCGVGLQGGAIYVVDMQTGTLLRRFVTYNAEGTTHTFAKNEDTDFYARFGRVQLTGSPALYDAATGSLASRGFVGDSIGRLFRMDFRDPDPANWQVDLFFDPYNTTTSDLQDDANAVIGGPDANFGPAAFKPVISRGPARQLVVTYGLGQPGETTVGNQAQAVITVAETDLGLPDVRWYQVLEKGEKLMGEPLTFDSTTYFPTYFVEDAEVCKPGLARIWGVHYFEDDGSEGPKGVFEITDPDLAGNPDVVIDSAATAANPARWFGPKDPTIIRGLTLTLGPVCSLRDLNGDGGDYADTVHQDTQPQLIAQSSAPAGGLSGRLKASNAATDAVGRLTKNLKRPRSMTVPLSWSVIQ